ncbi:hypothetical protein HHI36_014402 [Cryptolaemus montrouzieri]|uniref:Uncharacterized protein n=1 Tax=Cryptolaemus montrouzieri TaxID=559131 RepID=A0ABD2N3G3_9CUCU
MVSYSVGIACICSIHIQSDSFEDLSVRQSLMELPKNVRNLKFEADPTLYLPNDETETIARVAKRPRLLEDVQSIPQYPLTEFSCNEVEDDIASEQRNSNTDVGCQTDGLYVFKPLSNFNCRESETSKLEEKISELEKENSDLVNKLDNEARAPQYRIEIREDL